MITFLYIYCERQWAVLVLWSNLWTVWFNFWSLFGKICFYRNNFSLMDHRASVSWSVKMLVYGLSWAIGWTEGWKSIFSETVQKHFPVHLSKSIIWNGNISGWSARDKQICHVLYATRITMLNFWEHTKFTNKIVLWPVIHYLKTRHRNFICTYLAKSMTEQWLKEFGIKYKVFKKKSKECNKKN